MQPGQMAYDRGLTTFSPDGRLFQVEYAREAVKKGSTTLGIKFKDGVLLIADKRTSNKLVEPASIQKIYQVDETIGCATSGLVADARALVDKAREEAQKHVVTYGENIAVEVLTRRLCDYEQKVTQFGYGRPFGTSMIVAGVDDIGVHLFETDPSGAFVAYKATCIGLGRSSVTDVLEKEFEDGMTFDAALKLGMKALEAAIEEPPKAETVEVGVVMVGGRYRLLSDEEKAAAIPAAKAKAKDAEESDESKPRKKTVKAKKE